MTGFIIIILKNSLSVQVQQRLFLMSSFPFRFIPLHTPMVNLFITRPCILYQREVSTSYCVI